MHIRSSQRRHQRAAVVNRFPLAVLCLSQRFCHQLSIPAAKAVQPVPIGHNHFRCHAARNGGQIAEKGQSQSRIFFPILPLTGLFCALQHFLIINPAKSTEHNSHLGQYTETSANPFRNRKVHPVFFLRLTEQKSILFISNCNNFNMTYGRQSGIQRIKSTHWFNSGTGF